MGEDGENRIVVVVGELCSLPDSPGRLATH